jgi:O-antigen biosynthesis protein
MAVAVGTNDETRGRISNLVISRRLGEPQPRARQSTSMKSARARGKFLFAGEQKLCVRGVTYGPFAARADGAEYPGPATVAWDFNQMKRNSVNAIRVYSVPPEWLLDAAARAGLRVMVGLPWAQHVNFLDEPGMADAIEGSVRSGVRRCAGHPAVLCYAVGNEIPAGIVRWLGRKRVERFIARLCRAVKAEDPEALCTYVNFPTTEFLELPFLDLFCFNVYLESQPKFEAYLARLQSLAGDKPLLMTEIGLDSRRNGEEEQARSMTWQVRSTFEGGAAGIFVFSWTDEWHRGGCDIEDWNFGLTRRDRSPKAALAAVRHTFDEMPFASDIKWPKISVIVCTYNGGRTLRETFQHLQRLNYSNFEVIVVDDGSTDGGAYEAGKYGFRLIRTSNAGLSSARNTGLHAANGELVAYIDDDAYPDADWLKYLALSFLQGEYAGVGGPNIPPPGDGWIADCVTNSPGGPIHVLLTDREAEHIPGCNMAFRKSALLAAGGFDDRFRTAGDDVDICWNLQKLGWKLGFNPAAVVWHHRRNSIRRYWKQQLGYGRAEALLEQKWPEKYNAAGHVSWAGRVYGNGFFTVLRRAGRIYGGTWGSAPFQRLYQPVPSTLSGLILMPEWHLIVAVLGLLTLLGLSWKPLFLAAPLLLAAFGLPLVHAMASSWHARFPDAPKNRWAELRGRSVIAWLHLLQPVARLVGRVRWGLTPWRRTTTASLSIPATYFFTLWSEIWRSAEQRMCDLEAALKAQGTVVHRGGGFDSWDLEVCGGLLGSARLKMVVEEHGQERQLVRLRVSPRYGWIAFAFTAALGTLAIAAGRAHAWIASETLLVAAILPLLLGLWDCGIAVGRARKVSRDWAFQDGPSLTPEKPAVLGAPTEAPPYLENVRD